MYLRERTISGRLCHYRQLIDALRPSYHSFITNCLLPPQTIMSTEPSTYTSISNFMSIFNAALEYYKRKTKNDLVSHPLLPTLQSCDSPKATRDRIPAFDQSQIPRMVTTVSQNGSPWSPRTPTVNVLYAFSDTLGQGVVLSLRGSAFSSWSVSFVIPLHSIFTPMTPRRLKMLAPTKPAH
jgi:hypothetical protein